ncbi:hypothetical protein AV944_00510 [Sphingomonas sp. LK11]|uniref:hypothetical protein n=1 Tax=Sphingomonas sp. LK11 TaxID=1390395 RepID=UPI000972B108|nr:hypothetical protein [Sphingomonas sp. LK11]APX64580.1 hypothetical protein AV944_00510 [Sphingomonas sp. LK11]
MNEVEQMVAAYFHLNRSLRRKERKERDPNDRLEQWIRREREKHERRALRQARLEWAEDRDAWERQWR